MATSTKRSSSAAKSKTRSKTSAKPKARAKTATKPKTRAKAAAKSRAKTATRTKTRAKAAAKKIRARVAAKPKAQRKALKKRARTTLKRAAAKTKTLLKRVRTKTAKPKTTKAKAIKPKAIKAKTLKPKAVKAKTLKPKAVKAKTLKPKAVKAKAPKPKIGAAPKPKAAKPKTGDELKAQPERDTPTIVIAIPNDAIKRPAKSRHYLKAGQKKQFRKALLKWRQELVKQADTTVNHMQYETANFPDETDRATNEEGFGLELRTRDREGRLLRKIDRSLEMLNDGQYGYCEECGEEIGVERLQARLTATLCIDCKGMAEMRERQGRG